MPEYIFELEMKVRDYECDMQGIVNNANYQHYLEHTRHEFLLSTGASFTEMHEKGIDPVVSRIEINYKTPLKSQDIFSSKLYMKREGVKYINFIRIFTRQKTASFVVRAVVETVCTSNGRITRGEEFLPIFEKYL